MVLMGLQDLAGQSLVLVGSLASPVAAINNPEAERRRKCCMLEEAAERAWGLVLEVPLNPS